jgi:hypothetical protein
MYDILPFYMQNVRFNIGVGMCLKRVVNIVELFQVKFVGAVKQFIGIGEWEFAPGDLALKSESNISL